MAESSAFWEKLFLLLVDKLLLVAIFAYVAYKANTLLEELKDRTSRQQEFDRSANAAVVDLTKKLATGNNHISWLSWSATQEKNSLTREDFLAYDKEMIGVLSDLVGLQATVAALVEDKFAALSPFAQRLYDMDEDVGKARDTYATGENTLDVEAALAILKTVHASTESFDVDLLKSVTGLLKPRA